MIWLRRGSRTGTEIGVVLARFHCVNLVAIKRTGFVVDLLIGGGRETVYLCHFKVFGNFGAEIQRVGVVVRIWMIMYTEIKPTLYLELAWQSLSL